MIPTMAYGFLGCESITTTAFEAADRNALRFPSRYVAYLVTLIYFLSALGAAHSVSWRDSSLPELHARSSKEVNASPKSYAGIVLAAMAQGEIQWATFFTGALVFFCLSAANTALYVSSRTLYGLTRPIPDRENSRYKRCLKKLSTTTPKTRVPGWALLVSGLAFFWLPFLYATLGLTSQEVSAQSSVWKRED